MRFLTIEEKISITDEIRNSDKEKALVLFLIFKLMKSDNSENHIRCGILYREIGEFIQSSDIFQKILNHEEDKKIVLKCAEEYVFTLKESGKLKEAIQIFERYLSGNTNPVLSDTVKWCRDNED